MTNIQYKVVRIIYPDYYDIGEVQVYTIGSRRGWRNIGKISYFAQDHVGVLVNGALHWIDDKSMKIMAFNLADEEFRLIQSIPCHDLSDPDNGLYILPALKGNLCICHQRTKECLLDIWSLKKNATEASWTRNFSVEYDSGSGNFKARPFLITKKDEVVFVGIGSVLYCYDPKTTTVKKLWDDEKWEITGITASPHMNSFVSLKALGERSEIKKKVIKRSLEDTD